MKNHHPSNSLSTDVDVSIRLRRAINLNDVVLVKRIVKNNPAQLKNPDLNDNGNTSLHLAARLGFLDIVQLLVDLGHEDVAMSRNVSWDTPLHLAVETSVPIAAFLATRFPQCIPWKNKQGADVVRGRPLPFLQELSNRQSATDALQLVRIGDALRSHSAASSSHPGSESQLAALLSPFVPNPSSAVPPIHFAASLSNPNKNPPHSRRSRR
ncbi:MAG: hypothetical protein Q9168_001078 [Polycauliona sp. 1 TL-2023]